MTPLHRDGHVFAGGEFGKQSDNLEGAREPKLGASLRRQMRDVLAREEHAAAIGADAAGDLADERCFSPRRWGR